MIKAAFFDIDGTLVSLKTKVYPPSAKEAVAKLREKGILCFVATGRSKFEIAEEHLLDGIAFDGYLTNNGQDAYDAEGHLLHGTPIDPHDAEAVLHWAKAHNIACWMVSSTKSLLSHIDERVLRAMEAIHTRPPKCGDLEAMLQEPIYKIVLFLQREEMAQPLAFAPHCRMTQWFDCGCDIISTEGGKKLAMLQILSRYGLSKNECIAFGDSENDIEMLRAAGIGVAMENGTKEAKAAADFIAPDCDDDGIFKSLVHFGLIERNV